MDEPDASFLSETTRETTLALTTEGEVPANHPLNVACGSGQRDRGKLKSPGRKWMLLFPIEMGGEVAASIMELNGRLSCL